MNEASLLAADEPSPVSVTGSGASRFVVVCEHAGNRIPAALGTLGLDGAERRRHIAWDIGAQDLATGVAAGLDAVLLAQTYSRLVCDCNRRPAAADFIPEVSETTEVPGNRGLSPAGRAAREAAVFRPFHDRVAAELDRRAAAGERSILVTVHSFTPVYKDVARPWEIGVLFNRDRVLSPRIAEVLEARGDLVVGINQPYFVSDETDYTVPVHGEARGIPCVELEIRNDLLGDPAGIARWTEIVVAAVAEAARAV